MDVASASLFLLLRWPHFKISRADRSSGHAPKSKDLIPESVDKAMDDANPPVANGAPGISIRNGPMEEINIDESVTNGYAGGKRKARNMMGNGKTCKEASEEDEGDDKPIVCEMNMGSEFGVTDS